MTSSRLFRPQRTAFTRIDSASQKEKGRTTSPGQKLPGPRTSQNKKIGGGLAKTPAKNTARKKKTGFDSPKEIPPNVYASKKKHPCTSTLSRIQGEKDGTRLELHPGGGVGGGGGGVIQGRSYKKSRNKSHASSSEKNNHPVNCGQETPDYAKSSGAEVAIRNNVIEICHIRPNSWIPGYYIRVY